MYISDGIINNLTHLMGNVMVLKPFETSLSIVYKGKGEVKVRGDVKAEHSKFQRLNRVGLV